MTFFLLLFSSKVYGNVSSDTTDNLVLKCMQEMIDHNTLLFSI